MGKFGRKERVLILGAAGRDFHNFLVYFKDNPRFKVVGFTATQIPKIEGRLFPKKLAGKLYPKGIPIFPEEKMEEIIKDKKVDTVVMAYSDISHETVMHLASRANAMGANFVLMGHKLTFLESKKPVIAVCAVRTGCGKSQTSRKVAQIFKELGKKVVVIRHPMPYGKDLQAQRVQRFETLDDLKKHNCTIEEREEYEAHIGEGNIVYAGIDYKTILKKAEEEGDIIIWDGGNNDIPFIKPNIWITVTDPFRAGHEILYYPGEVNFRSADIIIINKVNTASKEEIEKIKQNVLSYNPKATVVMADSEVSCDKSQEIEGKRVLVIEDGPTLTHGEMSFGAGKVAAEKFGAKEIVDPRPYAVGSIKDVYDKYKHLGNILPAMGYYPEQIKELEDTINKTPCDLVLVATPIDLTKILKINKPSLRIKYTYQDRGSPTLAEIIKEKMAHLL